MAASATHCQRLPRRVRHRPGARQRRRHRHHRPCDRRRSGGRAAAWWWSWTPHHYDALAGAVCAGHVIECGTQATGGNFSGFRSIADLTEPGFPIAEIAADGSSVITKNPGTGGAVTTDTVTAQLLYEIGDPAYLNPDVITHLDTATLSDLGDNRVEIHGVQGSPPPPTTKVAITGIGGWENNVVFALTGTDLDQMPPWSAIIPPYASRRRTTWSPRRIVGAHDPDSQMPPPSGSDRGRHRKLADGRSVAEWRAGAVELPGAVRPRPAATGVAIRHLLAGTAGPVSARAHGPPPRRRHRERCSRHGPRRRGCGRAARRTIAGAVRVGTVERRAGRRLAR